MNLYRSSSTAPPSPTTRPSSVPTAPMTRPCARKIRRIDFEGIPIALRMPISRVLSATTMVSVLTMLNAATMMMSSTMKPIVNFSSLSARNSELFCCCQSSARYG